MTGSESTPLSTRVARVKLRELKLLADDENANSLDGAQFQQLVENLRSDGVLTSAPLVHQGVVLSGNHRVRAAIEAGIEQADVIEVVSELDEQRKVALQLSHNAIHGSDDPNILARLYRKLDLQWKKYSGLTDNALGKVRELDIKALALGQPDYHEVVVLFLPEEQERFLKALDAIKRKLDKGVEVHVGRFEDFDAFFDAMVRVKKVRDIHNSAIALRTIAELALEALEREENGKEAGDA